MTVVDPLLLGAVNDVEDLAARAMDLAPDVWLNPLFGSGNGFGVVFYEMVFMSFN